MISAESAARFLELCKNSETILLVSHEKPDGDAIAALSAMYTMLTAICGATIYVVDKDAVPEAFQFLPHVNRIQQDFLGGDIDCIIALDCGDAKRTGFLDRIGALCIKGRELVNVDHHPKSDLHNYATLNIWDGSAASTTQLLYTLAHAWHVPITSDLATAIYTGLYTDTGSFQHAITTPEVLQIASEMLAHGAHVKQLHEHLSRTKSVAMLRLWGRVLERIHVTKSGVVSSAITQADIREIGASEDDLAGAVAMLESTQECRVALLLAEVSDHAIKGSLRSNKSGVDVARLAKHFGGGGHPRAAGFLIDGQIRVDKSGWNVV